MSWKLGKVGWLNSKQKSNALFPSSNTVARTVLSRNLNEASNNAAAVWRIMWARKPLYVLFHYETYEWYANLANICKLWTVLLFLPKCFVNLEAQKIFSGNSGDFQRNFPRAVFGITSSELSPKCCVTSSFVKSTQITMDQIRESLLPLRCHNYNRKHIYASKGGAVQHKKIIVFYEKVKYH